MQIIKASMPLTKRQKEIYEACKLTSPYKKVFVCTGRQVGKTHLLIQCSLDYTVNNADYKVGFFMPSWKQCRKVFAQIKRGFRGNFAKFNNSSLIISFNNGSQIQFFTAENDNCRGFTHDAIVIDEACFVKDEIYQAAIIPTVLKKMSSTTTSKILCFSTPKNKNWFYKELQNKSPDKAIFKFTSEEGGLIAPQLLAEQKRDLPPHVYSNEYLGEFFDSGLGIFQYKPCLKPTIKNESKSIKFAAVDWGVEDDYTVLSIMNNVGELIYCQRIASKTLSVQVKKIAEICSTYKVQNIFSEKNGIGIMPTEELKAACQQQKTYRPSVIEWVTTSSTKTDAINRLISDFQNNLLTIPTENPDVDVEQLLHELDNFALKYDKKNGKMKFEGENGAHDDFVMSLAIVNFKVAKKRGGGTSFAPLEKRR